MSNIFNIQQEYFDILNQIEENDGEITDEISNLLESNEGDYKEKLDNYLKMIHYWEGLLGNINAEIERIGKLKKSKEKAIETLKENISVSLQSRSIEKLDLGTHILSFRKSDAVIVTDPTMVPKHFLVKKVTESIDKTELKKWLKEGNSTEGAYVEERQNLQIK